MEFVPRITRAQAMDALSSQANLAGYRAVIEAAEIYGRALPMMMTAAGTVAPAKALILGAGVAGLQAIGHRPAPWAASSPPPTFARPPRSRWRAWEAKFIAVEDEEFKAAGDRGRLRQGDERRIPGQAGRAGLRAHQEAGHRHHHPP